jgi:CMP-N,N'-diacetyllegionaminic acid synthase
MRILALITARGGSKRLPGKNIRTLGGKPLVVWSIDVVRNIPQICDILVSTDDPAIASICKEAGAYVPWLRPSELASDKASSVDAALHALDWYETEKGAVDGLLLLQPTSPFRTKRNIQKGIDLFYKNALRPVLGVSPIRDHPMWSLKIEGNCLVPFMQEHGIGIRSQDLPDAYVVNGSFYLISPKELYMKKSFLGANAVPLIVDVPHESLDIDTEWDFMLAEIILDHLKQGQTTQA